MSDSYKIVINGGVAPEVVESLTRLKGGVNGAQSALTQLGSKLAQVFAGYKILEFGKAAIDAADDLNKFSQEVGVGVEKLSGWKYAADLSGVGDKFRQGMLKFSGALADSTDHSSKAAHIFDVLKVKTTDLAGNLRPTSQVFEEIADKFAGWSDGANKAAIAEELFGTKNARFITMLNGGSAGLKEQAKDLESLGGAITADKAAKAEAFNDSITRLKAGLTGLSINLVSAILPTLEGFVTGLTNAGLAGGRVSPVFEGLSFIFARFTAGVIVAYGAIETFGTMIGATAAAATETLKGNFSGAHAIMVQLGRDMDVLEKKHFDAVGSVLNHSPAIVQATPRNAGKQQAPSLAGDKQAKRDEMEFLRNAYKIEQDRVSLERAKLKANFDLTSWEKRDKELELLNQESNYLSKQIELLKQKRDLTSDETERASYSKEINSFEDKARGIDSERAGLQGGADPRSVADQMRQALTQLREEAGTLATNIASLFQHTIKGSLNTVSSGIMDIITRTRTMGQVWSAAGRQMVSALVQMAGQYLASKLAMMAVDAVMAKRSAANNATTAATAIPAGIAQAGAQGGWVGILLYIGVFAAAMAAITALAAGVSGGFESGGYTGDGGTSSVAGVVHGKEYVLNAPATAKYRPILDAMNRQEMDMSGGGGRGMGASGDRQQLNVSIINDRQDAREFQARDGWKITADKMAKRGVRL